MDAGPKAEGWRHIIPDLTSIEYERYRREQAGAYLRRVRAAKKHIESLNATVDEMRSLASGVRGIDYTRDMVQTSANGDAIPDAVARLMQVMEQRIEEVGEFARMVDECSRSLAELDGVLADILRYRYLCGWPWERIALELNYSEQWLYDLHNRALSAFYDHMPPSERDPVPSAM